MIPQIYYINLALKNQTFNFNNTFSSIYDYAANSVKFICIFRVFICNKKKLPPLFQIDSTGNSSIDAFVSEK